MDLRTHYPYSLLRSGLIHSYPSLKQNKKADVAIIGCGITGALVAWQLYQKGIDFIIVDKRHVATGSTAASTSLIQYEIDVPLYRLQQMMGKEKASRAYHLCKEAIDGLQQICRQTGNGKLFEHKHSLQFASFNKHVKLLENEYAARRAEGFKVDLLSSTDIKRDYHFNAPAALLSDDAAQMDAYVLTHNILKHLPTDTVFDHTEIIRSTKSKTGHVLKTNEGFTIHCKQLVIACGYESSGFLRKNTWEEMRTTYAFISEPLPQKEFWKDNCLIWETSDPYLYMRTCDDNRILVGGKDTAYFPVEKQLQLLPQKVIALKKAFEKRFPHLPLKVDFKWAGAFAATKDGLPFIGQLKAVPRTFFALGYGGNGITFSYIAACQIAAAIKGDGKTDVNLFSFERR